MKRRLQVIAGMSVLMALVAGVPSMTAQAPSAPKKETFDGVRNFTNVDPTIACAGATEARVMPELARRGYKAVINLREATETGAAIDETRQAAEAAGIRFIHIPLNSQKPDAAVVDAFLKAVVDRANQPTFINCGSAGRVAALVLVKRMLVDGWSEERALEEAALIGPPSATMREFALGYAAARKK